MPHFQNDSFLKQMTSDQMTQYLPKDCHLYLLDCHTDEGSRNWDYAKHTLASDKSVQTPLWQKPKIFACIRQVDKELQVNFFIEQCLHTQALFQKSLAAALPSSQQVLSLMRADFLWQSDCFEFFFGQKNASNYIEINISVDGYYNLYRFDKYRLPEQSPPVRDYNHQLTLNGIDSILGGYVISFNIKNLQHPLELSQLNFNLTAILYPYKADQKTPLYYAINHDITPDFHQRDFWAFIDE